MELIEQIRGEKKFGSLDELKAQMANDIETSKRILSKKVLVK